jgi:hypothetical protein
MSIPSRCAGQDVHLFRYALERVVFYLWQDFGIGHDGAHVSQERTLRQIAS